MLSALAQASVRQTLSTISTRIASVRRLAGFFDTVTSRLTAAFLSQQPVKKDVEQRTLAGTTLAHELYVYQALALGPLLLPRDDFGSAFDDAKLDAIYQPVAADPSCGRTFCCRRSGDRN